MWSCPCSSNGDGRGPLDDIIKRVVSRMGERDVLTEEKIAALWKAVAGARAARHSRPVRLKQSQMIVLVDGSSWLYELTLRRKVIIERLGKKLSKLTGGKSALKDIRFRIGELDSPR